MATKPEFWAVLNMKIQAAAPALHKDERTATNDARNMAKLNPGVEYAVLRSVRSFVVEPLEYDHGDYPF